MIACEKIGVTAIKEREKVANNSSPDKKHTLWIIAVLVCILVIFSIASSLTGDTKLFFIKEGGLVETASAIGYLVAAGILFALGWRSNRRGTWPFLVLLLFFAAREFDFDKRFTDVGVLKPKFVTSPTDPLWVKIIGISIVIVILTALFTVLRRHGVSFLKSLKKPEPLNMSIFLGASFIVLTKAALDGFVRKMRGFGLDFGSSVNDVVTDIEESMEFGIPLFFLIAVIIYFQREKAASSHTK